MPLSQDEALSGCCYMVMDLRRVIHPPCVMFWTTQAVAQFSISPVEDILLAEFPSVAPVVNVFVDDVRADTVVLARRFPLVTALGIPADPQHLGCMPEPALLCSREFLMARPGHRAGAMRFSCALRAPPNFMGAGQPPGRRTDRSLSPPCPSRRIVSAAVNRSEAIASGATGRRRTGLAHTVLYCL